jgi:hypothetical protein
MKRGFGRVSVLVALIATLGGCATAAGDRNIIDDWAAMPSAAAKVPPAGVCYTSSFTNANDIDVSSSSPIPCTQSHAAETFHVGQFPAEVTALPALGKPDYVRAFEECEAKAKEYLGNEWYSGRIYLDITVPLTRQWEGGGRWFRCELIEIQSMYVDTIVKREGALAGALRGDAPLALRCGNIVGKTPDNGWEDMTPVDCAQPHDAEYAGSFKAQSAEEPTKEQWNTIYDGCWNVVAAFLGGSRDKIQVGYLVWSSIEEDWQKGDHWVRCYAWGDSRKLVGSVKGIGNATPRSG